MHPDQAPAGSTLPLHGGACSRRPLCIRAARTAARAAEDLALVPRVVAALHWRIAKSGRGPGPQAYVSPRALVHIWNAATAPDDRAVAALAALSWTMWLRVGEAASIRYCDLDRKEGLWLYSTKVGEPGWVCRPAAAYARSWMEFLRVYCQAKGKRPDEPVFEGGGGGLPRGRHQPPAPRHQVG